MEVLIRVYHWEFQEIVIHMFLVSFRLLLKLAPIDGHDLKKLYLSLFDFYPICEKICELGIMFFIIGLISCVGQQLKKIISLDCSFICT